MLILSSCMILLAGVTNAQTSKTKKALVIGVDGLINTAIDYASTPSIDQLLANASYSMNGMGGMPSYSSTGWSTILTGVSAAKHGVQTNNSFVGNHFGQYPSVVKRVRGLKGNMVVGSVVRFSGINDVLNTDAQHKFNYATDNEVFEKAKELLAQANMDLLFTQFSQPKEVGMQNGYQLRDAKYVLAVQQIDQYVEGLMRAIQARPTYTNENWAIFFVSTHGGTESGVVLNNRVEELNVPVIFSGDDLDKKELSSTGMAPKENADNVLKINKSTTGERTVVRVPIAGTELQGMDRFTMEMWIKAGTNTSDPVIIGDKDWGSGGNPGYVLCRSGSTWKINIANTGRTRYDIGAVKSIEDGNWHHIAVTFDKTKECIVYQDGEIMNRSALAYKATDDMTSPFPYLYFCQDGTGTYGSGGPNWAGTFNEVRIWTDVLTPETIKNYMYMSNVEQGAHPNLSSLNLYLKMDEVRGNQVTDYSGKGNHGQIIGSAVERHPYYPVSLTDVSVNILAHFGLRIDGAWGLEGSALKSNVPFRLFKVK